jgi:hypothetical protein
MVLYRSLSTSHYEAELSEAHMVELFEDQLYDRLQTKITIPTFGEDWQHLFRLFLRHRQEPRPQPSRGNHSLP